MPSLVRILLSVGLAGLPALAVAAPRTIADCEQIEAADAYNRCLASFGPPGRSLRLTTDAPSGDEATMAQADAEQTSVPRGKKRRLARKSAPQHVIRAKRMVFSVVSDRTSER
jgi:hypothetical protein